MRINAKEIARGLRLEGVQNRGKEAILGSRTWGDLQEALNCGSRGEVGGIHAQDFSLRALAAETIFSKNGDPVGQTFIEEYMNPDNGRPLQEAMGAVDSSAFAGITGQLLINRTLGAYTAEEFVASRLVPTVPTRLDGERIPGVYLPRDPGSDVTIAGEGEPLRYVGFGEEYVETPATVKRQLGIGITKEAIFFDRTGMVLDRAAYVGTLLGLQKEKALLGLMIGATNSYKEKRKGDSAAVSLKTFYSATDSGRWCNHLDGNPLTDWTNINAAEALFSAMTDPNTGEPIIIPNTRLIFAPQIKFLPLNLIMQATQTWQMSAGFTATGINTIAGNPIQNLGITMATSRQLQAQLVAQLGTDVATSQGYWFYGDPTAFAYMENWPITVVQAPTNSEAEFTQDIVVRFKASERGTPAVIEPRKWQRHRTLATSSSSGA
ncbi:MAG: hypothetical protein WCJ35_18485 [Planctomycetota bacterium]